MRLLGLLILIVTVVGALIYAFIQNGALTPIRYQLTSLGLWQRYEPLALRGVAAGGQYGLLEDPEVKAYLKSRYNLELAVSRAGSLEMVHGSTEGVDFLWPSDQMALEAYKAQNWPLASAELVLHSPLVLYSWDAIAGALEANGTATKVDDRYYMVDLAALSALMFDGTQWSDLGLPGLHGRVRVVTADPTKASSASGFAGLLANTLNGGEVVDEATVGDYLPQLGRYFAGLGLLQSSSADLFAQYLRQGPGPYPIVVGYENQLVAFGLQNKQYLPPIRDRVRILYPRPTVWSSHPLIVVNPEARRLADALRDPEVQRIAGAKHGFRTGLAGTWQDPGILPVDGVGVAVDQVTALPNAAVMARIVDELGRPRAIQQ
jgi:hypothetical protein